MSDYKPMVLHATPAASVVMAEPYVEYLDMPTIMPDINEVTTMLLAADRQHYSTTSQVLSFFDGFRLGLHIAKCVANGLSAEKVVKQS